MSTITLEAIKKEHSKISEMIAALEAQPVFPMTISMPTLNEGERYVGVIVSADGTRKHHIIKLPGKVKKNWQDAMAWAESIGGELPDRCESALLFATMKDEFEPEWHWLREQHASDSNYAWSQGFYHGYQHYNDDKSSELCAVAVRRVAI